MFHCGVASLGHVGRICANGLTMSLGLCFLLVVVFLIKVILFLSCISCLMLVCFCFCFVIREVVSLPFYLFVSNLFELFLNGVSISVLLD